MADFNIEIEGDHIVITIPGTSFSAIYRRGVSGMDRMGVTGTDLTAPIALRDFITVLTKSPTNTRGSWVGLSNGPPPLFLIVARKPQVCLSRCASLQSP
jgi:hypothetical protein